MDKKAREYAQDALKFIQRSGSNFLACKNLKERLENNGFINLSEGETWNLNKNEGYVLCKENRNICGFFVGKNFNIDTGSILISIGHIDSCALKISPNNNVIKKKIHQINVECYGSGLWHTWFDRSLGLSGQVLYKKGNKLVEKLIQINKSVVFLPSLAIHLQNRTRYDFSVKINYENHIKPIISTTLFNQLNKCKRNNVHHDTILTTDTKFSHKENSQNKRDDQMCHSFNDKDVSNHNLDKNTIEHLTNQQNEEKNKHTKDNPNSKDIVEHINTDNSYPLLYLLSKELNCKEEDILDFELCLMDTQEPCFTGVYEEFIEGARFDNLLGSFCVFEGFIELVNSIKNHTSNENTNHTNNITNDINDNIHNNLYISIGYDHEEIGSLSEVGARSYCTKNFIDRIISSVFKKEIHEKNLSVQEIYGNLVNRSFILNVDMAHCSHPNYPETVQDNHQLFFHEGIAIKYNTNKNYVTSPLHASLIKRTFELYYNKYKQQIKYQNFMVKNDTPCGSTVGSMVAANLSMPGIDIGIPQLAMHSIREIAAVHDVFFLIKGVFAFYTYYNQVLSTCVHDK